MATSYPELIICDVMPRSYIRAGVTQEKNLQGSDFGMGDIAQKNDKLNNWKERNNPDLQDTKTSHFRSAYLH